MKAILDRRSIRKFERREVPDDVVDSLLEAALAAPSASNRRPFHFVVVKDRAVIDRIPGIHPYAAMAGLAPLAITVCADTKAQPEPGYFAQDCSAATQNILLEATDQGLGSVWCGIHPRKERIRGFSDLLGLPEWIVPFSLVVLGYPAESRPPHGGIERFRIHIDRW